MSRFAYKAILKLDVYRVQMCCGRLRTWMQCSTMARSAFGAGLSSAYVAGISIDGNIDRNNPIRLLGGE